MNFAVHAVMYTYFAATASTWRRAVLRFAPLITALQISQFAFGTYVNAYAAYYAYVSPSFGCAIHPTILYLGAVLYLAYGALFVRMFVRRYIWDGAGKCTAFTQCVTMRARGKDKVKAADA